jgi:hypothetical protein
MFADAVRGELGTRLQALWAHRTFHSPYERPLLLVGAVRYDALCEGPTHPLHPAVAADPVRIDALTPEAFAEAIAPSRSRFEDALRTRAVQTNETTRAVTWLWPASMLFGAGERRPLAVVDLGASAGLNLVGDELPALWVDDDQRPIPVAPRPPVQMRLGLDLAPLDVRRDDDALWLRACVWPSDQERQERLQQAIAAFKAKGESADAPVLEACSLVDAPDRLHVLPTDVFVLCVQTIVRDYLGAPERERYEDRLRRFLLSRPRAALVAELEVDLSNIGKTEGSATLVLRFATGAGELKEMLVARTHPHPRRLFVDRDAVDAFMAAIRTPQPSGGRAALNTDLR